MPKSVAFTSVLHGDLSVRTGHSVYPKRARQLCIPTQHPVPGHTNLGGDVNLTHYPHPFVSMSRYASLVPPSMHVQVILLHIPFLKC